MTKTTRIIFPAILCLFPLMAPGQPTPAGTPEVLISNNDYFFMNPRFSPDGTRIAFTTQQYRGLWVADANGRQAHRLTGDAGAGFQYAWSPDSRHLVTGVSREEGPLREFSLKLFSVTDGEQRQLSPYTRQQPPLPAFSRNGTAIIYHDHSGLQTVDAGLEPVETGNLASVRPIAIPLRDRILISFNGSPGQVLRPVAGAGRNADTDAVTIYLWSEVSPDGQKLAFRVYGGSLYLSDLNGNNLIDLGPGEAPAWSPDSRYLSYMITEDDGHEITGSDIYIVDTAGDVSAAVNITAQSGLNAMHPTWSADGSRIAFGDVKSGIIYQVRLQY